jgi:Xaa-Pro aminopeptidase
VLNPENLAAIQGRLRDLDLDGWLLADFQGTNPIAVGMLGFGGMLTRRHFGWVPRTGVPVAIEHWIEPWAWAGWPAGWERRRYVGWRELEAHLAALLTGRRVAMEYSPGNAVPYLDRIPGGLLDLVRAAGAEVVSSADLVTRFYARWSPDQLRSHQRAAEQLARIAPAAIILAGERAASGRAIAEHELRQWVIDRLTAAGLVLEELPIVAAGSHSADVHYQPSAARPRPIVKGDVLLVDLWAREPDGVYADQTWMGFLGAAPPRIAAAWEAQRAARDAAITLLEDRVARGVPVRGSEVHDETLRVLAERGWGRFALGRAGHSIDPWQYHGAGPNLDSVETRDDRVLSAGIGFSIEPGIYVPGEFGIRSEVNGFLAGDQLVVTPRDYQRRLIEVAAG